MADKEYRYRTIKLKYKIFGQDNPYAYISSDYGIRDLNKPNDDYHEGMDLLKSVEKYADGKKHAGGNAGKFHDNIYAAQKGKVYQIVRNNKSAGNYITLQHGTIASKTIVFTRYLHMDSWDFAKDLKEGMVIEQGTFLGKMGNTGHSQAAHLHFDMPIGDKPRIGSAVSSSQKNGDNRADPYPYLFGDSEIPPYGGKSDISSSNQSSISKKDDFKAGDKVIILKNTSVYEYVSGYQKATVFDDMITEIVQVANDSFVKYKYRVYYDTTGDMGWISANSCISVDDVTTKLLENYTDLTKPVNTVNIWLLKTDTDIDPASLNLETVEKLKKIKFKAFQYQTEIDAYNRTADYAEEISGYKYSNGLIFDVFIKLTYPDGSVKSHTNLSLSFTQQAGNYTLDYYYIPKKFTLTYDVNGGTGGPNNAKDYRCCQDIIYSNQFKLKSNDESDLKFNKDYYDFIGWSTSPNGPVDTEIWGISYASKDREWLFNKDINLYAQYKKRELSEFRVDVDNSLLPDFYKRKDNDEKELCLSEYSYKYKNTCNEIIANNTDIESFESQIISDENYREYTIIEETINDKICNYFPYFERIINPFITLDLNKINYIKNQKVALKGCFPTFELEQYQLHYNDKNSEFGLCKYVIERTDDYLLIKSTNSSNTQFEYRIVKDEFKDNTVPYQLLAVGVGAGGQGACIQVGNYGDTYGYGGSSGAAAAIVINLFDAKAYITVGKASINKNDSQSIGINNGCDGTDTIIEVVSNKNSDEYSKLILQGGNGGKLHSKPQIAKVIYESTSSKPFIKVISSQNGCLGHDYKNGENCSEFRACIANESLMKEINTKQCIGDTGFYWISRDYEGGKYTTQFDDNYKLKFFIGGGGASIFGDGGNAMSCIDALSKDYQISYGAGGSCTYVNSSDSEVIAGGKGGNGVVFLYY